MSMAKCFVMLSRKGNVQVLICEVEIHAEREWIMSIIISLKIGDIMESLALLQAVS